MATTDTFAHINEKIGMIAIIPEVTKGSPNWSFKAKGTHATTTIQVNSSTGTGDHDTRLAGSATGLLDYGYVYVVSASNVTVGSLLQITAYVTAGSVHTFTVETADGAFADDDTFYVFGILPFTEAAITPEQEYHERKLIAKTLDPASGRRGLGKATVSAKLELGGLTTSSVDGSPATADRWSMLLAGIGTRRAGNGEDAVTGTLSTTQSTVTLASEFNVGDWVTMPSTNAEATKITAVDISTTPDIITFAPALTAAQVNTDLIIAPEQFNPADSDHQSFTFLKFTDDRRQMVAGCVFNYKISGTYGEPVMMEIEGQGNWDSATAASINDFTADAFTAYKAEQSSKSGIVWKAVTTVKFSTTTLCINSFEFDLGAEIVETRDTCAGVRMDIRGRNSKLSVTYRDQDDATIDTWVSAATVADIIITIGSTAGAMFGIGGQAQLTNTPDGENKEETRYWNSEFTFVDDQTDDANNYSAAFMRW